MTSFPIMKNPVAIIPADIVKTSVAIACHVLLAPQIRVLL